MPPCAAVSDSQVSFNFRYERHRAHNAPSNYHTAPRFRAFDPLMFRVGDLLGALLHHATVLPAFGWQWLLYLADAPFMGAIRGLSYPAIFAFMQSTKYASFRLVLLTYFYALSSQPPAKCHAPHGSSHLSD